jgi:WD40 repeat protein
VVSQSSTNGITFLSFDPANGTEKELLRVQQVAGLKYNWSLSPDGSTIAGAEYRRAQMPPEIELFSTSGRPKRTLAVQGCTDISSIDWSADGRTLWLGAGTSAGTRALVNADLSGRTKIMLRGTARDIGWAIPSPDGRRIAMWQASGTSNAWLLRNF